MKKKIIDIENLSSFELRMLAREQESREYSRHRFEQIEEMREHYKDKEANEIPVLKHLRRGADEIVYMFANSNPSGIMYGDGEGSFFVMHENKITYDKFVMNIRLDYEKDMVYCTVSSENMNDNINDVINILKKKENDGEAYCVFPCNLAECFKSGVLASKVFWKNKEEAIERIVDDDMYVSEKCEMLAENCFGLNR